MKAITRVVHVRGASTDRDHGYRLLAAIPNMAGVKMYKNKYGDFRATQIPTPKFSGQFLIAQVLCVSEQPSESEMGTLNKQLKWLGYTETEMT